MFLSFATNLMSLLTRKWSSFFYSFVRQKTNYRTSTSCSSRSFSDQPSKSFGYYCLFYGSNSYAYVLQQCPDGDRISIFKKGYGKHWPRKEKANRNRSSRH